MEIHKNIKVLYAKDRKAWRRWLVTNHRVEKSVWLVIHHKKSATPGIYIEEAVEEALCFGWIDSTANKRDETSKYQYFAVRKPTSNWSKINRERAGRMIREKRMTPAGQSAITHAKKIGPWTALTEVEALVIPADLKKAFARNKKAFRNFSAFPPSSKKIILYWLLSARRPETRHQRIRQTVELAELNQRANHHQKK
jgi:uncharacterized protein YdeI (YjbR/CyaY-like superfamily)